MRRLIKKTCLYTSYRTTSYHAMGGVQIDFSFCNLGGKTVNYSYEMSLIKPLLTDAFAEKEGSYIVDEIITHFPTMRELMNVSEQELLSIKGIGKVKARQIVAALQLAQRLSRPTCSQPQIIRKPQDAADLLMQEMRYLQQEHFVTLFLNTKNHVIGQPETLSIGSLNAAIVHPAVVFRAAVKRSSASIVVCHNHPSGDPLNIVS